MHELKQDISSVMQWYEKWHGIFKCLTIILLWTSFYTEAVAESDLTDLSIEELMSRKVVTASRTEQTFSDTAAAVFVINQDDIRRSGVNSIPEVLRLVPGIHVARIDSSKWAISARGFNGRFANNLLVLMDGRILYIPSSSGVFWEIQDRILEDIERIEVIRGPGASVWGANAVNGIINIITKNSVGTEGGLVSLVGGDRSGAGARYGWQFDEEGFARIYAKFFRQDGFEDQNGNDTKDDWLMSRGGFRMDWTPVSNHSFMAQADVYDGSIDQNLTLPSITSPTGTNSVLDSAQTKGGNLLARWEYSQSLASRLSTQFSYEYFSREDRTKNERYHLFDIDFQHEIALNRDNEFNWGLEYRFSTNHFRDAEIVSYSPRAQQLHLISAFLQNKLSFFNQQLELTLGSKFEYHTFSGFQYQPTVRALWKITNQQRIWAAFSRATRVPSIGERNAEIRFAAIPQQQTFVVLQGNSNFDAETVLSYELGYRFWSSDMFSFDLVAFYNDYDDLIFTELSEPTEVGKFPLRIINGEKAKTWGVELTADWRPFDWIRFQAGYSYLRMKFDQFQDSTTSPAAFPSRDKRDPATQASLRSSFDLGSSVEFDLWLRYVDSIPDIEVINAAQLPSVDSYVAVDVRLAWRPHKDIELAFVGRNLNDPQHLEYLSELATFPVQIERRFYIQGKWTF